MAPPRKRKNTARQRRKQVARTEMMAPEIDEAPDEPKQAATSVKETSRGRGKKPVPAETWPRRELGILIGVALVLLAIICAVLAAVAALAKFDAGITFVSNFVGLNPILLVPATWVGMILVHRRLGIRRMRFMEVVVMVMMFFFIGNTASGYLTAGLAGSTTSPSSTPRPTAHATPTENPATSPSPQVFRPSPSGTPAPPHKPSPSSKPCPVDNANCSASSTRATTTQFQEFLTAGILSMLLAIATTVWGYPTVYRWFWGPRKPRTPPARGKAKPASKGKK